MASAATFTVTKTADTNDGTCDADCSLREAITAANALGGSHMIAFNVPSGGLTGGVAVITLASALPPLTRNGITIDGTTQTSNQGNTNPSILGAGGTVGVDGLFLSQVAGPEVEIRAGATIANGLHIQANNVVVRGLAILGFGAANGEAAIRVENLSALIENNVLGSTAIAFSDPGVALRNYAGVESVGGSSGTIQNNVIGFGHRGVFLTTGSSGWTISGNEIRDNDLASTDGDGIAIADSSSNTIVGNLITGSSSQGLVVTNSSSSNFVNNTVIGNGVGSTTAVGQSAGITMRSTATSTTIDRNIIQSNYGAGIQVNDGATGTTITRNSFADNGTILARDLSLPTDQIGIDLNVAGDDNNFGTPNYFSVNTGADSLLDFPILESAIISAGNLTLTGWSKPAATIELFIANVDPFGFGEGETFAGTFVEGSIVAPVDADPTVTPYSGLINGLDQGSDTTNRFSFTVPLPAGVADGTFLTSTASVGTDTSEFSGVVAAVAASTISGRVFEDADFAGIATDYNAVTDDVALANVDVELYSDADAYISSTTTDGSGNFSFAGIANGTYKVRARTATIGDSNTPPSGAFNGACGITDPVSGPGCVVPELTWANGAAAYGGQSATADDTSTNNNAGPGDTWTSVVIDTADVANVNFGFAYNLIANTNNAGQGSLRQFVDNANEIGSAGGTTANSSEFRIPLSDPNYNAALGAHTITLSSALPLITDSQTVIDGQTQTDNVGSTNAADFTHPFYGAAKTVGTGVDGIAGTGDEFTLSAYPNPEIEINGNDVGSIFRLTADAGVVKRLALYNSSPGEAVLISGGNANLVEENYVGTRADGSDPGLGLRLQHGLEITGGSGIIRNNVVAFSEAGGSLLASTVTISGNDYLSNALQSASGDAVSTETSSGQAIAIRDNRFHDSSAYGIESWNAQGPFTIENNTVSDSGNGGGLEIGGIRIFGANSTVRYNIVTASVGAGIVIAQTGASNSQNLLSRNSTFANGGLGIDIEATDFVSPDGDGVTPNNGAMDAGLPNNGMDYPVLTVSTLSGSTLHVEGYVGTSATRIAAVHTLEFYKAADDGNNDGEIELGDTLNVAHGEGQTYIDSCSTAATGNFICDLTVPVSVSLSVGEDITGIAYDTNGNTSEYGAISAVASPAVAISGTIFEDIDGNVLDGAETIGDTANPVVSGVDVYLYLDDGGTPGLPDATDTVQNGGVPVVTNGSGVFTFPGIADGSYWAVVDSRTVSPAAGVHPSYLATTPWSEQTYGPDLGWCADGTGGTSERAGPGPCFGGVDGATADDASALTTSEHIARVVVSGAAVSNVDFGFSYNVVTNVEPAGNVSLTANTYQGSIDQFVRNANSVNGANAMRFVPAVPTNASGGGGAWWQIDYTGSIIGETITNTHDANTSINGSAFDLADGVAIRNTNPGNLGANAGGGLTAGVDDVALPQVARPELEIMRSDPAVGVAFYFYSNSSTGQVPDNFAVRDVATWGFVGGVGMTGIAGLRPSGVVVERNVVGSGPDAFSDPAIPGTLRGVALLNTDGATIRDNLIGFVDANGITASAVTGTTIRGNEIREAAQVDNVADGINYGASSTTGTITANLIADAGGMGIDGTASGNIVANNTVTGSGQLGVQTAGIRQTGSANTIRRNVVTGSAGPGIIVPDTVNAISITENHFGSNGSIAIDSVDAGGDTAVGDGVMLNDGGVDAADGNDGLDFPVIDSAVLSGGNLTVTGFARAGVTIEFYEAVAAANDNNASGNPHGEGVLYLFTSTEGVADADATTGASYTDPGYGTDPDVNRFSFTVPAPAALAVGEDISAIANLAANGSSEFGPNFAVTGALTTIAGTIFVDEAGDGLADGPIGPAPNAFESGARIELFRAGPDGNPDGGDDTYVTFTTSSAVDGSYTFTGLSPDTYYVTVDSQGVDDGPYNGAYTATDTWAEQTYGPIGAASFDGVSTWTYAASAGAFYGGARWDVSDDHVPTNSLPTGEHIAAVDTTGGNVSNVDFGFSFNVVTTTRGGNGAQDPGAGAGQRTVQGSLRQFITNANAQSGANAMRFVPAAPANASLGGNSWWRTSITAQLPNIEDAATTIDGSAYNPANGVTPFNTNTAAIGAGAAVGVAGTFNTPLLDPELEIQGDNIVNNGLFVLAGADNSAIRNLAITSFAQAGIRPAGSAPDFLDTLAIENNVIGTSPASFADNPALFVGRAIVARDLDNSTIRNNLIGWTGWGIQFDFDNEDTLIETNEIRGADTWGLYLRGVASTGQQPERLTVQGNLVENNGNDGIYTTESLSNFVINQNSVRSNATGIRLWGANNSVTGNVITDNAGTGLLLTGDGLPSYAAPAANLISQNIYGNNGLLGIDLVETGTDQDGVTLNDNGDVDLGANELLNYPIIVSAQIAGPDLVVSGFAAAGSNIEFYIADADPSGFGEGVTYLFNAFEGSGADTDATSGSYGPGPINGLAQGTDTANRFTFTVPTPGGVGVGTDLTATGTIAGATSEFSGRTTVSNDSDLVTTKVLDPGTPGPFAEGDAVTYLLTVTNTGPAQATNVTATDTYPAELTLGVPVPSAPTTYDAGTGVWTIGTLSSGASATLSLPGTINAGTAGDVITNNVTAASGDQADPTTVGDDLSEAFAVLPFLSINDVAQIETDSVPGTTTFTFTVSINQAIGNNVTFDFDTADGTATVADSDYVAISGGSGTILAGATTTTIDVTVNGDDGIEANETFFVDISNVVGAAVTDAQGQGTINNDDGAATVSIAATTNGAESGPVDGLFTVTQSATTINDTVLTYVVAGSATSASDYAALSGTVTILGGATTATISVPVIDDAIAEGIDETVIVTLSSISASDPGVSIAASPLDTASLTIADNDSDLVTTKSVSDVAPVEGDSIIYTILVANSAGVQATNVSLTDLLPAGVTYVSDDSGGNYESTTGVWNIGTLDSVAPGNVATLNITATVDLGAGALAQPITNTTTAATGDQPDPDTATDNLTADITVNYNANLVTTKTVDNASPQAGDTIIYTLTVVNNGPAPASNVSLADVLPAGVSYLSDDSAGAYDPVAGAWTIGSIANGATAALNISAIVDNGAGLLPQPITNTTTAASGDQTDADNTGDDLAADIVVDLIDPNLIQLNKTVGRDRANVGEIVAYSVEIRNTTGNAIAAVQISDSPARGFKYVPGSAQLNGISIADPAGGLPIEFDTGVLPGFVDSDGSGSADPGEPGYAILSYRMVAGAGVAPGIWTNTAIATATCDVCFVSNIATADIEIVQDTLFDLGTIIGKVFYDADGDGWQDSGEAGIEAAMVALDDGTYALTDRFGRYHFPAVKPGQRLLKINLNSLAGRARATRGTTRIVNVTPGLMAKANYGVVLDTVDAAIGDDGHLGIAVDTETIHPPLLINGSTVMPSLLVNGEPVALASADVRLGRQKLQDVVELSGGRLAQPIRFITNVGSDAEVRRWTLKVSGTSDETVKSWKGKGAPPEFIEWDGMRKNGRLIHGGGVYTYHLELSTSDGQTVSSSHRLFGVNRSNSISLNLAGGAFISGSHALTNAAKGLLSDTAEAIRAYPDEIVVISGHTDSVGTAESNMALAERRARAAYDYLRKEESLPEEQFVIQAFGETRPIAGNDTGWGRELNRRVEISGDLNSIERAKNYDPYRQPPVVRINSKEMAVDASGAFRGKVELEPAEETLRVLLGTSGGSSVEATVRLPTLEIISPQGRISVPVNSDRADTARFDSSDERTLLHTEVLGRTEPENTIELNGEALDIDDNGLFLTTLPLRTGENVYGLVVRNPTGILRIANLKLTLDEANLATPEFFIEPIPQLALQLPPPGIPMTNANLVVPGTTVPGNRVFINDREIEVGADGSFSAMVALERGENLFTARVVDADGHSGEIEQRFSYNGDPLFFMALIDGTVSKLQTSGNLAAAGKVKREETISEGRIAYYLKGHVLGKYLLTSAFDSGQQEFGKILSDLTAQDNDRLLTNLDPDTLYPVYGDSSTLVYDAQSQGKFYLALESDALTALVGNYALNFTDTELASYQRTLYGASVAYQSAAKDAAGNPRTKVQAFHANIAQAHVRDEVRATGGSLYYLSRRDVIEGSEHISVIVRDQDSGLVLRRTALQQGLDYSIDYVDGRLLTNRPISSFTEDYSLIESDLLGGSAVYLQIDYETALGGFEQTASGARIRQGLGERLAVGVTAVDEDQLGGHYSLQAADAELRLGENSRLIAEVAASEGNNSIANVSVDGGLTYQTVAQTAGSSGDAYKIAAEIDIGEWFGAEDRLLLNTYFKHLDTGFSANSVGNEQGSEKRGVAASWKISDATSVTGRFEQQTNLLDDSENTLGTVQWNLIRKQWGLAAEVEDREGFAGESTLAAMRANYRWTDALSTSILHQQTLAGIDNDRSTLGVSYRASDMLTLDASATHGTKGDSAKLGAQMNWRGNRLYFAQQFNDLEESGLTTNRLVGAEAPFGMDGAVYSEYHWSRLPNGRQGQALFGARQRFQAMDGLRIEISGEHSAENAVTNNTGERYALSIGATFDNARGITLATRNEYRKDSRSIASEQFISASHLKLALSDDLAVLGNYRFSKSESSAQADRNIDFTEASIGLAYRPVEHDRLNLLTRFTRLNNTPTEFQTAGAFGGLTSDIFAVDWSYQLTHGIEWVGKQAMRWSDSDDDPTYERSRTSLSVQRLNWSMPKDLLFGTEYRVIDQNISDDRRTGFVTELMWEGLDPLILGLGYNFSDVSDSAYVDYDFSTQGPFFRLQGKF
ncbi:MAG: right-handed parallel beta-helix repeat-containing protein [Gammaproteobacteria bacterium]|nr:right-handed parallel beta-helix repeat-containing protein [Gammaproteobacteria bacterium]NNL44822.1 DUF11 domain-containing protein [Woeseiaceae bacterium]